MLWFPRKGKKLYFHFMDELLTILRIVFTSLYHKGKTFRDHTKLLPFVLFPSHTGIVYMQWFVYSLQRGYFPRPPWVRLKIVKELSVFPKCLFISTRFGYFVKCWELRKKTDRRIAFDFLKLNRSHAFTRRYIKSRQLDIVYLQV